MSGLRRETQLSLQNILDCFTGEDGGVKFAIFKAKLEDLDQQAANSDKAATELVNIMNRFSKLIDVLGK